MISGGRCVNWKGVVKMLAVVARAPGFLGKDLCIVIANDGYMYVGSYTIERYVRFDNDRGVDILSDVNELGR